MSDATGAAADLAWPIEATMGLTDREVRFAVARVRGLTVRQAAIHVTGLWRDKSGTALVHLLGSPSAQTQRAAAEALGRIGDKSAVPALLKAVADADEPCLGDFLQDDRADGVTSDPGIDIHPAGARVMKPEAGVP